MGRPSPLRTLCRRYSSWDRRSEEFLHQILLSHSVLPTRRCIALRRLANPFLARVRTRPRQATTHGRTQPMACLACGSAIISCLHHSCVNRLPPQPKSAYCMAHARRRSCTRLRGEHDEIVTTGSFAWGSRSWRIFWPQTAGVVEGGEWVMIMTQ